MAEQRRRQRPLQPSFSRRRQRALPRADSFVADGGCGARPFCPFSRATAEAEATLTPSSPKPPPRCRRRCRRSSKPPDIRTPSTRTSIKAKRATITLWPLPGCSSSYTAEKVRYMGRRRKPPKVVGRNEVAISLHALRQSRTRNSLPPTHEKDKTTRSLCTDSQHCVCVYSIPPSVTSSRSPSRSPPASSLSSSSWGSAPRAANFHRTAPFPWWLRICTLPAPGAGLPPPQARASQGRAPPPPPQPPLDQ